MKIVLAKNIEFNRKVLESKSCDILLSPDNAFEQDSIKYLNSGLNGILVRIAAKNNIRIGIDLDSLRNESRERLALRLARISQNIRLCKKARVNIVFTGQKDEISARALLTCLGASSQQTSKAKSF